ncbi:MAG: hypothetical protein ACPGXK_13075 [Phycisphaerae bacterium]
MALGKRIRGEQNQWVATYDLPKSPGHHFYDKLNGVQEEAGFDEHVEGICEPYYSDGRGRPGVPPGVYFRMLLIGYFEGRNVGSPGVVPTACHSVRRSATPSRTRHPIIRR